MDFLKILTKFINRFRDRDFRRQIEERKEKQYLFRANNPIGKNRGKKSIRNLFWGTKNKKLVLSPYTSFFQKNIGKPEKESLYTIALGYIGGFLILASIYVIFFSPYFQLSPTKIVIETQSPGIDLSIAYRAMEDQYHQSLFFLDEKQIGITLKKYLKNISKASIDKLYPNGLKIIIDGYPIRYIATITGLEKSWAMTENGVLTPMSKYKWSGALIPLEIASELLGSELFLDYKWVIPEDTIFLIGRITDLWRREWPDLIIEKIRYLDRENELHIAVVRWTKVILSLQWGVDVRNTKEQIRYAKQQLINLKNYIRNHPGELASGRITYIDMRIDGKIFLCSEAAICKNNLISVYGNVYR
jgi:POTRA domain, FtsQ-type